MHQGAMRRAAAAALMLSLLVTTTAFAESTTADADAISAGDQGTIDLGRVAPGADAAVDVAFRLDCSGTSHLDAGQSIRLSPGSRTIPPGGSFSVGSVTLTPGVGWPADGEACPTGLAGVVGNLRLFVTAPLALGTDLRYVFAWNRTLVPTTAGDASVLEGANPSVTIILDVVDNTPPTLALPGATTVEGDTTGGAIAAYAVSASDAEDATAPTPTCSPANGTLLPIGTTSISCSATDTGGLTTSGTFDITVVDTTAPTLAGMPADRSLTTTDPSGTTATWAMPTATDIVDPAPAVACTPPSGSQFALGTTTVTCTATDGAGNDSSGSFSVVVTPTEPEPEPDDWSAVWARPVATDGATLVAHRGRTIPVKVELFADGVEQTTGRARLEVATCDGTIVSGTSLTWRHGRWTAHLHTARLRPGCYVVTATLDGHAAGSFRLDVRGHACVARRR